MSMTAHDIEHIVAGTDRVQAESGCMQHVEEGYEGHGCGGGGCGITPVCGPPAGPAGAGQRHRSAQCEPSMHCM